MTDYRQRVVSGVGWTALQNWLVRLAGFLTFVVISRSIGPRDIGLVALAVAITGLIGVVAEAGLATYLVRAEELGPATAMSAFWATLAVSLFGAGLLVLVAEPVSVLVGQPGLRPILPFIAVDLVLASLARVPNALLTRDLRFRLLAVREMCAAILSGVVGVALALAGAGVWALVTQTLVASGFSLVFVWSATRWRPRLVFSVADTRLMLRFGLPLLATTLVQATRDRFEQLVLGALGGAMLLGYYVIATRLLNMLVQVTVSTLDTVALPAFVRAARDGRNLSRVFESATTLSAALLSPLLAGLAVLSPVLVPAVFGATYSPAVPPAQLFCLAYAAGAIVYFGRPVYISMGRTGLDLLLTIGGLVVHLVTVLVTAPHGLNVLALAVTVESMLVAGGHAVVLRRVMGLGSTVYRRALRVTALAAVSAGGMQLVLHWLPDVAALEVFVTGMVGAVLYLGLCWMFMRSLVDEVRADLRGMLPSRSGSSG